MISNIARSKINKLIAACILFTTIAVSPTYNLDPINLPKLWAITIFSFALLVFIIFTPAIWNNLKSNPNLYLPLIFILILVLSMISSEISLTQQLFGTYGRNTGFLTYFSLAILFVAITTFTNSDFKRLLTCAIVFTLGVNAIYGAFQANNLDLFDWVNPYSPVIGTLGNPNFIAAFLGMGIGFASSYLFSSEISIKMKTLAVFYILIAAYDIFKSDAQQGIILSFLSIALTAYFSLRAKFQSPIIRYGYLTMGCSGIFVIILGTLQKGPLSSVFYQQSVTYRGDYWNAGFEMFRSNPWFGVGLDAYGDYYRAERTLAATLRRGPSVVSNAAHNVFIDIAATAGIFAFLTYLALIFLGLRAAWKISQSTKGFDPFFVSVFVMWVAYLIQSLISINNLGLAIWGWVLPSTLIAISRWAEEVKPIKEIQNSRKKLDYSGMLLTSGLVLGSVLGFLPFNADASLRYALESGDNNLIQKFSTKWPTEGSRIMYAVKVYEANKLPEYGIGLARIAVNMSPRNFDAWWYLYNSSTISGNEKREILDRLKALDPHNPDLAKLG